MSVADPEFSEEGFRQLQSWAWKSYYLVNFLPKTAWEWKKLDPEGARVSLALPRSANVCCRSLFLNWDVVGSSCQNETKPDTIPRLLGAQIAKVANQKK